MAKTGVKSAARTLGKSSTQPGAKGAGKVAAKGASFSPPVPVKPTKGNPPAAHAAKAVKAMNGVEPKAAAPARRASRSRVAAGVKDSSICREVACESLATTAVYCRLHYIKNWKKIRLKAQILSEGKLNQFIDELVGKYPGRYIEAIRLDLSNDKDFMKVVSDLELAEPAEEFENTPADAEGSSEDGLIETIRRSDFDDEAEAF